MTIRQSLVLLAGLCACSPLLNAQEVKHAPTPTVQVGNVELSWTMSKQEVISALKKQEQNLVVPAEKDESSWLVIDQEAKRTSAKLLFDDRGRLVAIRRNWTPESYSSDEFVKALYNLVSQHVSGECEVGATEHAEPQAQTEEVLLICKKEAVSKSITQMFNPGKRNCR